jgi:hypothetical protein
MAGALRCPFAFPFPVPVAIASGTDRRLAAGTGDRRRVVAAASGADEARELRVGRRRRMLRVSDPWQICRGRVVRDMTAPSQSIGGAANQTSSLFRGRPKGVRPTGSRAAAPGPSGTRGSCPAGGPGKARGARRPGRRCRPVTGRIAPRPLLDRAIVAAPFPRVIVVVLVVGGVVAGRLTVLGVGRHHGRGRRRRCRRPARPRVRRFPARPLLERRTDRERAREAVRLLVRQGARRGLGFGVATVSVVRSIRPLVPLVFEGDERTGRGRVRAGSPSLGHRNR